jgi:putative transposase
MIKIKINSIQKKTFNKWNDHSRLSYNKAIGLINNNECYDKNTSSFNLNYFKEKYPEEKIKKVSTANYYSKLELRNLITPENVNSKIPWILETPKAVREGAVFEAHKNFKSAITNFSNGNIKHFKLGFQSKKNKKWSIVIPKESINIKDPKVLGIYEERTTNFRIRLTEKIEEINNDCKIHYNGKDYFFCSPYKLEKKLDDKNKNWFCSLDPGIRKFQVIYNADEDEYMKIGDRASIKIYKLLRYLDYLSKNAKKNHSKMVKLRIKIQDLQKELHYKLAKYLCDNFNNIYIPKLTKNNDIIKLKKNKKHRTLNKSNVRKMTLLGHCKFIERLKTKALEYDNVNVRIITEEYTSQTCINCNVRTKTSKEIFKCKNCNLEIDRDVLGSTNILLFNW